MIFTHSSDFSTSFNSEKFEHVTDMFKKDEFFEYGFCLKPRGGFWGTLPGDDHWDILGVRKHHFNFSLKAGVRILNVYEVDDLVHAMKQKPFWSRCSDWEWMAKKWDAVIVHEMDNALYHSCWDIPSVVVLNPKAIK